MKAGAYFSKGSFYFVLGISMKYIVAECFKYPYPTVPPLVTYIYTKR